LTSEGAVADLLRKAGGSWVIHPADAEGVRTALGEAYECWKDRLGIPLPDRGVVDGFDRRALAGRFAEVFERLGSSAPAAAVTK
jgi:hypothetical protein